ncbi:major capsid protein P2 [Parvibaculaceae bacterium PLY_AMNH_Bact1]|nr:major capsid protein P2 [Parvibaculaceae bacterium PLY_AMNH_Bact1]
MGIHYNRKLPDFSPVQAGAQAAIQIPRGPTYRTLILKYARGGTPATEAQLKSDIEQVRIKVNGTTRWAATGTRLVDILTKYYGHTLTDGLLFIDLARHDLATIQGADNLAWGTNNVQTLTLEVDIASGAVNPEIEAHAVIDPVKRDLGMIVECWEVPFSTAVGGTFEISTIPEARGQLFAMHVAGANATGLEVEIDNVIFQNAPSDVLNALYARVPSGRVPQADYQHYTPTYLDRLDDVLPLSAQDWRLKVAMSAAGSADIFMETLNQPLGPAAV